MLQLNSPPSVSVVIPLYNKRRSIERAIRSVLAQNVSELEVIVVDDGSTDGSAELVTAIADARIHLIQQVNAGPGRARNVGASHAKAPLLSFLDADDEWKPDFLSAGLAALEQHPDAVAYACGFDAGDYADRVIDKVPLLTSSPALLPPPGVEVGHQWMKFALDGLHSSATIVRRSVFERAGGYFDRDRCLWGEDSYLWSQVLFMGPVFWDPVSRISYHIEDSDLGYAVTRRSRARPLAEEGHALVNAIAREHRPAFLVLAQRTALDDSLNLAESGHLLKSLILQNRYGLSSIKLMRNTVKRYLKNIKMRLSEGS